MRADAASGEMTGPWAMFAAGHGLLSLVVFILLVVFCFQAFQGAKAGSAFFPGPCWCDLQFLGPVDGECSEW